MIESSLLISIFMNPAGASGSSPIVCSYGLTAYLTSSSSIYYSSLVSSTDLRPTEEECFLWIYFPIPKPLLDSTKCEDLWLCEGLFWFKGDLFSDTTLVILGWIYYPLLYTLLKWLRWSVVAWFLRTAFPVLNLSGAMALRDLFDCSRKLFP